MAYQIAQLVSSPNPGAFACITYDWPNRRCFAFAQNPCHIYAYSTASFATQTPYANTLWPPPSGVYNWLVRTAADGFLIVGGADASSLYKLNPTTLAQVAQFGPGSYPNGIGDIGNIPHGGAASVQVNGVPYMLCKRVIGGNAGLVRTDTMRAAGFYGVVSSESGLLAPGASGTASGSIYTIHGAASGSSPMLLRKLTITAGAETWNPASWPTQNPHVSLATIATIQQTDLDASWTGGMLCTSIGYDVRNNIVVGQFTDNATQTHYRFAGFDGSSGARRWNVLDPANAAPPNYSAIDLAQCRIANGYIAIIGNSDAATLATINTGSGAVIFSDVIHNLGSMYRGFSTDDVSGLWFGQVGYASGAGAPTPVAGTPSSFASQAMILGALVVPPPVTGPSLSLDNLLCTATVARPEQQQIWLDWSDDRGHSYGNPVAQPLGARGNYLTSVQWQRLGYARDRVFRLTWSCPISTALQGAWIEVDDTPKS